MQSLLDAVQRFLTTPDILLKVSELRGPLRCLLDVPGLCLEHGSQRFLVGHARRQLRIQFAQLPTDLLPFGIPDVLRDRRPMLLLDLRHPLLYAL